MSQKKNSPRPISLSQRQHQCLQLVAEGHTAAAIAYQLGISVRMVRGHLSAARTKLGARSTTQAVHIALKLNLLD